MCRSPPPPPCSSAFLGLARLSRLAAVRKKCRSLPPPPPPSPAHQLFWDLRDFRGWRRSEKKCRRPPPPLFLIPGSAPGYVTGFCPWRTPTHRRRAVFVIFKKNALLRFHCTCILLLSFFFTQANLCALDVLDKEYSS